MSTLITILRILSLISNTNYVWQSTESSMDFKAIDIYLEVEALVKIRSFFSQALFFEAIEKHLSVSIPNSLLQTGFPWVLSIPLSHVTHLKIANKKRRSK